MSFIKCYLLEGKIMNKRYLLKSILERISEDALLDNDTEYLNRVIQGPGAKEVDIEWMTDGVGYYVHEHILKDLSESKRHMYLEELKCDAKAWLSLFPEHYPIEEVCSRVGITLK